MMSPFLKKLLELFPYFFDKTETSNFFKSQSVSANQFKEIYSDILKVYFSFQLNKPCLIWRTQSSEYFYKIHFIVEHPSPLKLVKCFKNGEVIYTRTFLEDENIFKCNYIHEDTTLNDGEDNSSLIIPDDTFSIYVESFKGDVFQKGYPENDEIKGDIFDHDKSLDNLGKLHNIPRREYVLVTPDLYPVTNPPFCNSKTEEDYFYMKRIIQYLVLYHSVPLPIAEVWKRYDLLPRLENREKLLLKTFDEVLHGEGWIPSEWEHKDKFCDYSPIQGAYFFIQTSTNIPTRKQKVNLTFLLLDGYGSPINLPGATFDISLGDEQLEEDYPQWTYIIRPSQLSQLTEKTLKVDCKNSEGAIVGSAEVDMRIRGCQDANLFVSDDGDDTNNGKTPETPLATIGKACSKIIGSNDLIAILGGDFEIEAPIPVGKSCTIMGCDNVTLQNTENNTFFEVNPGVELNLQDILLEFGVESALISDEKFTNKNSDENLRVIIPGGE